jgi:hypothetical protein
MSEAVSQAPAATGQCIACREQLAAGAAICSKCREYQSRWRNELKYWAAMAGIIALAGSAVIVATGYLKSAKNYIWPADIVVLDYDTFGDLSMVNPTSQNVLVKYLYVRSGIPDHPFQWDVRWDINSVIEPKRPLKIRLPTLAAEQFRGESKSIFGNSQGKYAQGLNKTDEKAVLQYERNDKYVPAFLSSQGVEYRQVKDDIGPQITSFPCKAQLNYVFLDNQTERTMEISCIAVVKHRTSNARVRRP